MSTSIASNFAYSAARNEFFQTLSKLHKHIRTSPNLGEVDFSESLSNHPDATINAHMQKLGTMVGEFENKNPEWALTIARDEKILRDFLRNFEAIYVDGDAKDPLLEQRKRALVISFGPIAVLDDGPISSKIGNALTDDAVIEGDLHRLAMVAAFTDLASKKGYDFGVENVHRTIGYFPGWVRDAKPEGFIELARVLPGSVFIQSSQFGEHAPNIARVLADYLEKHPEFLDDSRTAAVGKIVAKDKGFSPLIRYVAKRARASAATASLKDIIAYVEALTDAGTDAERFAAVYESFGDVGEFYRTLEGRSNPSGSQTFGLPTTVGVLRLAMRTSRENPALLQVANPFATVDEDLMRLAQMDPRDSSKLFAEAAMAAAEKSPDREKQKRGEPSRGGGGPNGKETGISSGYDPYPYKHG
jgi:hypothetical protein